MFEMIEEWMNKSKVSSDEQEKDAEKIEDRHKKNIDRLERKLKVVNTVIEEFEENQRSAFIFLIKLIRYMKKVKNLPTVIEYEGELIDCEKLMQHNDFSQKLITVEFEQHCLDMELPENVDDKYEQMLAAEKVINELIEKLEELRVGLLMWWPGGISLFKIDCDFAFRIAFFENNNTDWNKFPIEQQEKIKNVIYKGAKVMKIYNVGLDRNIKSECGIPVISKECRKILVNEKALSAFIRTADFEE